MTIDTANRYSAFHLILLATSLMLAAACSDSGISGTGDDGNTPPIADDDDELLPVTISGQVYAVSIYSKTPRTSRRSLTSAPWPNRAPGQSRTSATRENST
jgi:hypothetical protein